MSVLTARDKDQTRLDVPGKGPSTTLGQSRLPGPHGSAGEVHTEADMALEREPGFPVPALQTLLDLVRWSPTHWRDGTPPGPFPSSSGGGKRGLAGDSPAFSAFSIKRPQNMGTKCPCAAGATSSVSMRRRCSLLVLTF